jgi:tetratricopeptide (TPR) repeat protein
MMMENRKHQRVDRVLLAVVCAAGISAAWVLWHGLSVRAGVRERERVIAGHERDGFAALEARQWERAEEAFRRIDSLMPGTSLSEIGLRMAGEGIAGEKREWMGRKMELARSAYESADFVRVMALADEVLARFPGEAAAVDLKREALVLAAAQRRQAGIAAVRTMMASRRFDEALRELDALTGEFPGEAELAGLRESAEAAKRRYEEGLRRAEALFAQASERDRGVYDGEALSWLREAMALAPDDARIRALHARMDGYGRVLRVPGDFGDPNEAIRAARRNDRILLGEGVWDEPLWINTPVTIEGRGRDKTVVECEAARSCALTVGPGAVGCRVKGVGFRHSGPPPEQGERWSVGLVRGGSVAFDACSFEGGGGHGLAVVARGSAQAESSLFRDNCWNGAAVIGAGSRLELRRCVLRENFENGVESWDGAALQVVESQVFSNTRNGLHADNRDAALGIDRCRFEMNHEFGVVLRSAGSGRIAGSSAGGNGLGGFVIHAAAGKVAFAGNRTADNRGPGLVLERGLARESYNDTRSSGVRDAAWITAWDPRAVQAPTPDPSAAGEIPPPVETVPRAIPVEEE